MQVKIRMVPTFANTASTVSSTAREEIVITGSALEVATDGGQTIVRIPYGSNQGTQSGRVLFSAPERNIFYVTNLD